MFAFREDPYARWIMRMAILLERRSVPQNHCETPILDLGHGIFVALALCIALPKRSKSCFFNSAYFRYTVGLTVAVIIMNWFAAQPALNFALGVIGLVIHWLWNGEVKQDGTNQLMSKMWNWINIYGTKLKKFYYKGGSQDDYGDEEDVVSLLEDHGYSDEEDVVPPLEDYAYSSEEDSASPLDDRGAASADSDNDIVPLGQRAVQLLSIRANFRVCAINGYDWTTGRCIYRPHEREVQEEGMVDLVPIGPRSILLAYGTFTLEVFHYSRDNIASRLPTSVEWDVCGDYGEELAECTQTICCRSVKRKLEITYLVIPHAIETNVEVKLKFKDLGSRNRAVYGKIMASTADYGNKSVHLFSCERGWSWSVPSGPTTILPLSPAVIALPHRRQLELHIEVDLIVITIFENQEEYKNLKFSLTFTRGIRSQEREVDGDQVEVSITFDPEI